MISDRIAGSLEARNVHYGWVVAGVTFLVMLMTAGAVGAPGANLVFGWIFAGHQIGAATAAYGGGFARTEFTSYRPAFVIAGALCLVAAGMALTLGSRKDGAIGIPQAA